jgi:HEAT repeat protein/uncharacterized protein YegL
MAIAIPLFLALLCGPVQEPEETLEDLAGKVRNQIEVKAERRSLGSNLSRLANFRSAEAVTVLADLLPKLQGVMRLIAIEAIGNCKVEEGSEFLRDFFAKSRDVNERFQAVNSLAHCLPEDLEWLKDRLKGERQTRVKAQILRCLIDADAPRLNKIVLKALADKKTDLRMAGLHGVAELNLSKGAKAAVKALSDANVQVRIQAANTCKAIGGKTAFEGLVKAVREAGNPDLLVALSDALDTADDAEEAGILVRAMRKEKDKETSLILARAIGKAAAHEPGVCSPALIKLLDRREAQIREAAVDGLISAKPPKAISALVKRLSDTNPMVRGGAARALFAIGEVPEEAQDKIQLMAKNSDPAIRLDATTALGCLPPDKALKALSRRINDEVWAIRDAAVEALEGLRIPDSILVLAQRLEQEKGLVRREIALTLTQLTGEELGDHPGPWLRWLGDRERGFQLPSLEEVQLILEKRIAVREAGGGIDEVYHGLPIPPGGVVFILDTSGSMNNLFDPVDHSTLYQHFSKALSQSLERLTSATSFSIVLFDSAVRIWKHSCVEANVKNINIANDYLKYENPFGGTNIYAALRAALEVEGVQTIFLLTDGEPSVGLTAENEIVHEVTRANRHKRVRINTLLAGESRADFLGNLARLNGGEMVDLRDVD